MPTGMAPSDTPPRSQSPLRRPDFLEPGRQVSNTSTINSYSHRSNVSPGHIGIAEPERPRLPKRHTWRGESTRSISEALRLARSREEQQTLLGEEEQADDDGCYPPRKNDDPRTPNPWGWLPVYTTIHRIRRLIIASIGMLECLGFVATVHRLIHLPSPRRRSLLHRSAQVSAYEHLGHSPVG